MSTAALNPLVEKVRAAHPGAYDDMDDATLTKRVLAKYPQYSDLAAPKVHAPPNPISATQTPEDEDVNLVKGIGKSIYDVSAPGIVQQLFKKFTGQPNEAEQLPGKIMSTALPMMIGDEVPPEAMPARAPRPAPAAAAEPAGSGTIARLGKVFAHKIPGVKLFEDVVDAIKGPAAEPPPVPTPKPAPVPETNGVPWGNGKFATPLDQFGKTIPRTAEPIPTAKSGLPPVLEDGLKSRAAVEPFSQRQVIPATHNIRQNEALVRQAEQVRPTKGYGSQESLDDRGINQEFSQDLQTHGEQAEEEMRREFAARNTSGVTKQELTGAPDKPVVYSKTKSASGKGSVQPKATAPKDLMPLMEKMLKNARKGKGLQR